MIVRYDPEDGTAYDENGDEVIDYESIPDEELNEEERRERDEQRAEKKSVAVGKMTAKRRFADGFIKAMNSIGLTVIDEVDTPDEETGQMRTDAEREAERGKLIQLQCTACGKFRGYWFPYELGLTVSPAEIFSEKNLVCVSGCNRDARIPDASVFLAGISGPTLEQIEKFLQAPPRKRKAGR